jgi:hypothetical protein
VILFQILFDLPLLKMEEFSVRRVTGDGNCLFPSIAILLENDESQYDAMR